MVDIGRRIGGKGGGAIDVTINFTPPIGVIRRRVRRAEDLLHVDKNDVLYEAIGKRLVKRNKLNLLKGRGPEGKLQSLGKSTIKRRAAPSGSGGSKPLIATGQMRRSLTHRVKKRGKNAIEIQVFPEGPRNQKLGATHQKGTKKSGKKHNQKIDKFGRGRVWMGLSDRDIRFYSKIAIDDARAKLRKATRGN